MTVSLPTIHPGEIIREDFLKPLGLTAPALADRMGLSVDDVERIVHEQEGITPDVARRLAEALGTSPEFWMNLASIYEHGAGRPG